MKPTLLILAAGMGSRYGSLKQIDRFGPSGETIVEYSIYDALRAGFGKIVIVVRHGFIDDFREIVVNRAMQKADIRFVYQELENLPEGFSLPQNRIKPWGTAHAVLMADHEISSPFAVINADDFYGADSYRLIYDFLSKSQSDKHEEYCLVDYRLGNTLSESGYVSRGVCHVDNLGYLSDIHEHKKICRNGQTIISEANENEIIKFTGDERVSMNLMGFLPSMLTHIREQFIQFLRANIHQPDAEFYLPFALNEVIRNNLAKVKVLSTHDHWFGVTYREDRKIVSERLHELVKQKVYPKDLWA